MEPPIIEVHSAKAPKFEGPSTEGPTTEPSKTTDPPDVELISVCKCLLSDAASSEDTPIPKRKQKIFSTVSRTEAYLRERRIPELIRYILAKIICSGDDIKHVTLYAEKLLDECMIYRSGLGKAPVLFEDRHLEAIIHSFDPGNRGWLSAGQVRRAYATLCLPSPKHLNERIPRHEVFVNLKDTQERELFNLLNAGTGVVDECDESTEKSSSTH